LLIAAFCRNFSGKIQIYGFLLPVQCLMTGSSPTIGRLETAPVHSMPATVAVIAQHAQVTLCCTRRNSFFTVFVCIFCLLL
jgi:hypothetical protein